MTSLAGSSACTLVVFSLLFTAPRQAHACSYSDAEAFEVTTAEASAPPAQLKDVSYTVTRGRGPEQGCDGTASASSCDDIGKVALHFTPPADDRTPAAELGYVIRLSSGKPPFQLPEGAVQAYRDGDEHILYFHWLDGATDDQESLDFALTIAAMDSDGNVGPASPALHVRNTEDSGCAFVRSRRGLELAWVSAGAALVATALLRRRRAWRRVG